MKTLRNEKSRNTSLLDSPDQNITGIPVSDFMISGDSILYKIGVASASFRGIIDRDRKVIRGVLTQRGDNYPLDLFRKDIPFFTPKPPKLCSAEAATRRRGGLKSTIIIDFVLRQ
jgi:hypothetical protein